MHFVYDIDFILAGLRRIAHLLYQAADSFYRVVRSCINLIDTQRATLIKASTRNTGIAWLCICRNLLAIDSLGQDPGTRGFTDALGATKQESMGYLFIFDSMLQRSRDMWLSYYMAKSSRTIFSG